MLGDPTNVAIRALEVRAVLRDRSVQLMWGGQPIFANTKQVNNVRACLKAASEWRVEHVVGQHAQEQ